MFTLIIGASGSGKSQYAEELVLELGPRRRFYVATMKPWDEECLGRIARHKAMRSEKGFETIEWYENLERLDLRDPERKSAVLLECLSNLVSNQMFPVGENTEEFLALGKEPLPRSFLENGVIRSVVRGIHSLKRQAGDLIVVTNDIFSDGYTYDEGTERYRFALAFIHRELAGHADRVVEVAAGIPVMIKDRTSCH